MAEVSLALPLASPIPSRVFFFPFFFFTLLQQVSVQLGFFRNEVTAVFKNNYPGKGRERHVPCVDAEAVWVCREQTGNHTLQSKGFLLGVLL